jgi:hypothetical protein
MIQVTFTTRRNKVANNPRDIQPKVCKWRGKRPPAGTLDYSQLDFIIKTKYKTHTAKEIFEISGEEFFPRVLYRILWLRKNGYIESKIKVHITRENYRLLQKENTFLKKKIEANVALLNRAVVTKAKAS